MAAVDAERPDRIVLLGDVLYHGPRNDLPDGYDPKQVVEMLGSQARSIVAVRGNCDAEVDQMVLGFPCMADYAPLFDAEADRELFLTHGHVFGPGIDGAVHAIPSLAHGSALVYGHTHKKVNAPSVDNLGLWLFNPGSVSLPKDGTHSCGVYECGKPLSEAFRFVSLE